jgi:hypothetical protein
LAGAPLLAVAVAMGVVVPVVIETWACAAAAARIKGATEAAAARSFRVITGGSLTRTLLMTL